MTLFGDAGTIAFLTFVAWVCAELIKVSVASWRQGRFAWEASVMYGSMPSSHTALVVGLSTAVFLIEGFSALFVVCVVVALLVIRDIMVIRPRLDFLYKNVKTISKGLERGLGHTTLEILVGVLIGIVVPVMLFVLFW